MAYSIQLPDGTLVQNIPDEVPEDVARQNIYAKHPELGAPQKKPKEAGVLESGLAGLAGGVTNMGLGAAAAAADYTGFKDTATNLDAKRKAVQEWQAQHGGDTVTGKIANIAGGLAPALAFPEAGIPALLANGTLFALPGFRDSYNEQLAQGASPTVAAMHGIAAAGFAMVGGQLINTAGKALPKALQAGEGVASQIGHAVGTGAAFDAASQVTNKGIDVASGRKTDAPWIDPAQMAENAAAFGLLRGAHMVKDIPAERRAAEAKLAEDAQAKQLAAQQAADAQAQQAAQDALTKADPNYVKGLDTKYKAMLQQQQAARTALGPKPNDPNDPSAALAWEQQNKALTDQFNSPEAKALVEEHAQRRPEITAMQAQEKAKADAAKAAAIADPQYQAQLKAQHDQAQAAYIQSDADLKSAMQRGDTGAIDDAMAAMETHKKLMQDSLQSGYTPEATEMPPPAPDEARLTSDIQKLLGTTDAKGNYKPGDIYKIQMTDPAGAKQLLDELRQKQKALQDLQTKRKAGEAATTRAAGLSGEENPVQGQQDSLFPPNEVRPPERDVLGEGNPLGANQAPPAATPKRRVTGAEAQGIKYANDDHLPTAKTTPDTTKLQEQNLFDDLEPGGSGGTPLENLRTQIEGLQRRPNMPKQTLDQLVNYARAIEHPAMEDANNKAAQNALEAIQENVHKIAYQGAGQGAPRAMSKGEVNQQIEGIDARLKALTGTADAYGPGTGMGAIPEALAAMRAAKTDQERFDRSTEYKELIKQHRALIAEREALRTGTSSVHLTPYERQRKEATTIPPRSMEVQQGPEVGPQRAKGMDQSTEVAGPATDKQVENSKRMVDGHPFAAGREVVHVNPEPADPGSRQETRFRTSPGEDGETVTHADKVDVANPIEKVGTTDRGLARIERGTKTTVGLDRAGPEDRHINDAMRVVDAQRMQAHPEFHKTMTLWDSVFGEGSKARAMVTQAEQGLVSAKGAVHAADTALMYAQHELQKAQSQLDATLTKDPTAMQRKILAGEETAQQNKVASTQRRAESAAMGRDNEAQGVARDWGNQQRELQKQVTDANKTAEAAKMAVIKAEQALRKASKEFDAEWARMQQSGEVTPEFVTFVGSRSLKNDLAGARDDFAKLLRMYEGSAEGDTAKNLISGIDATVKDSGTAAAARTLINSVVPEVDRLMGPKAAKLMDTIIRLQTARNIAGKGMELKAAVDAAVAAREAAITDALAADKKARVTAASAATKSAANAASAQDRLSALHAKVEVAQAVAAAEVKRLEGLQQKLEDLKGQEGEPAQKARAAVQSAQSDVKSAEGALEEAKKTADSRIKEAGANVERAKETRDMLFANEAALRAGKPMPLMKDVAERSAAIQKGYDSFDKEYRDALGSATFEVMDVSTDAAKIQEHLQGLADLEHKMTLLLQQHVGDFTEVQDRIASMRDTNALLASDVYDPDGMNAQRMLNRASGVAIQRHLSAEIARTMTHRDAALGSVKRALDAMNAHIAKGDPYTDSWHSLDAQRTRLMKLHAEKTAFFAERLAGLRERDAMAQFDRDITPENMPLREQMMADLDILRGLQDRMQYQLDTVNAHIKGTRSRRDAAIKAVRSEGDTILETLRKLGLSDREQNAPALRKQLMDSLAAQRKAEASADKAVADALQRRNDAWDKATQRYEDNGQYRNRADAREEFRLAKQAYLKAVADRATLHDQMMSLERMQLSLAEELMKAKPEPVKDWETPKPTTEPNARALGDVASALTGRAPEMSAPTDARTRNTRDYKPTEDELASGHWNKEDPEFEKFKTEVDKHTRAGQLKRWLGSLRAEHETLLEEAANGSKSKLTLHNAKGVGTNATTLGRISARGFAKATALQKQAMLFDRINYLQDRIDEINGLKQRSVESIADSQPSAGRRGPVMKKERLAGELFTGDRTPVEGRTLADGKTTKATTVTEQSTTGTRNPGTETKKVVSPTAKQVVEQANKDVGGAPSNTKASEDAAPMSDAALAKPTALRDSMARAKLERDLDAARIARSEAKERYDAVMAAPKASDKARENVTKALNAAKEAYATADRAMQAGTVTAKIEPMQAADDLARFRSDGQKNDTPLNDDLAAALGEGRIQDVVSSIASHSANPIARKVAARIHGLLGEVKSKLTTTGTAENPDAAGAISADGKTVFINKRTGLSEEAVLHEGVHAATMHELDKPDHLLTPEQRKAKAELTQMHEALKTNAELDNTTIRDGDLHEFVAEGHASRPVQELMARTEWEPKLSMWQGFKRALLNMLGMPTPPKGNMLDRMLSLSDKFMKAPEGRVEGRGEVAMLRGHSDLSPAAQALRHQDDIWGDVKASKSSIPLAMHQSLVDSRSALREAFKIAERMPAAKADAKSAAYAILRVDAGQQNTMAYLEHGAYSLVNLPDGTTMLASGKNPNFKTVEDAVAAIPGKSSIAKWGDAQVYMTHKRAENMPNGWQRLGLDAAAEQEVKAEYARMQADPARKAALEAFQDAYHKFSSPMVKLLGDVGFIPRAVANRLAADRNYIPWLREDGGKMNLFDDHGGVIASGDIRTMPFLQALKGGEAKIMPFEKSIFENVATLADMAVGNHARHNVAYTLQELGKVAKVMQIHDTPSPMGKGHGDILRFNAEPNPNKPGDTGERWLEINTEGTPAEGIPSALLAQAAAGTYAQVPMTLLGKAGRAAGGLLRAGVTRNPGYIINQLFKDSMNASMMGNVQRTPIAAAIKSVDNFFDIMRGKSKTFDTLSEMGALPSQIYGGDSSDLAKIAKARSGGGHGAYRATLNYLDRMAHAADSATRVQAYDDIIKAGGTPMDAAIHAQEMQNFHKHGTSGTIQSAREYIPFFGAQIQGLNSLVRSARGNMPAEELMKTKTKFLHRLTAGVAMSFMYSAWLDMNDKDKEWENTTMDRKLGYVPLGFKIDGKMVGVPTWFETGAMMWSLPQALYQAMMGNMNTDADRKALRNVFFNQLPANGIPIPAIAKGALEVGTNHDFFTSREVVSPKLAKLATAEQVDKNTDEMDKIMSGALTAAGADLSPVEVHHLAAAYLGQLPHLLSVLTDQIFANHTGKGEQATRPWHDVPFLGRFINGSADEHVNQAYSYANQAVKIEPTAKHMEDDGRKPEAQKYRLEQMAKYGKTDGAQSFIRIMGELRKRRKQIEDYPGAEMTADDKREKMDKIDVIMSQKAQQYVQGVEALRAKMAQ